MQRDSTLLRMSAGKILSHGITESTLAQLERCFLQVCGHLDVVDRPQRKQVQALRSVKTTERLV